MSNFRQKLKRLFESSFNENKKIDSIYQEKIITNNKILDSKIMFHNSSNLFIQDKSKTKNGSFINSIDNYNRKEPESISLYKKYKKYNSLFEKVNIKLSKNIFDSNKINYKLKTRPIFDNSLSSKIITKNKRINNSISTNHLTINNFFDKNNLNRSNNGKNYANHQINYRNRNYLDYQKNNNKSKKSSNRVGKIIKKIELIENENKEKKVKNLLINRSPIVFNNSLYKSSNYSYTYYISKSKNESKSKQKNNKKNKNFLELDDLKDIISSIKNQKYTIIKSKEFDNLNK